MNQKKTPLIDAIRTFQNEQNAYFRIPGHREEKGADNRSVKLLGKKAFRSDLTEAEGLDDLHAPQGAIRQAQQLAAELYGSDRCWFLVNGTTCGNEAMILSVVREGEKILVPRNAHKSVLMGLVLSGARPVWIQPSYDRDFGLTGAVTPDSVWRALERDPDIKAVFLVSPTYYGICSDIRAIASICHRYGIPLLVDEAHGAHLYFSLLTPEGALMQGADLCAQSTHKTAGSFTQSSMLHLKSRLVEEGAVDAALKLVMSTSPSYLLMASLDGARHSLAMHGREWTEKAYRLALRARRAMEKIDGAEVWQPGWTAEGHSFCPGADPLRLVFSLRRCGLTGYELQKRLYEESGISLELADQQLVVAVITWGNTDKDVTRLIAGVRRIAENAPHISGRYYGRQETWRSGIPEALLTPREAWFARTESVPLAEAEGRITAEAVIPYPPGIPVLNPGERIDGTMIRYILRCLDEGLAVHGLSDPAGRMIRVTEEPCSEADTHVPAESAEPRAGKGRDADAALRRWRRTDSGMSKRRRR